MQRIPSVYISGNSPVHRCDARVKLVLLLAYSVTLFCVTTWVGLGLCFAICVACCLVARLPIRRILILSIPLYVILGFTLVFNSFSFDVSQVTNYYGFGAVSAGIFTDMQPVALWGSFGFMPVGFARGAYFCIRMLLLVVASFVVSFTTTSTDLTAALNSFLAPLQRFKVPTADIAMIISIALRFIPLMAEELAQVSTAQISRGASFTTGSLWQRMRGWQTVFIPLFVALFRRADNLALAMESRCYGMSPKRTALSTPVLSGASVAALLAGSFCCVILAVFL